MTKTFNIFISHSWNYSDAYEKLVDLLNSDSYFSYKNYSVPKDDPIHTRGTDKELYEAIMNKIQLCNVVLIMAGVYSTYSKWINKEIRICKNEFSFSKPVIGIKPWASTVVSSAVAENADILVSWNSASIIKAIRELA